MKRSENQITKITSSVSSIMMLLKNKLPRGTGKFMPIINDELSIEIQANTISVVMLRHSDAPVISVAN